MSTLLLVRHGQASFGSENYDRLSALGELQVGHLREHFRRIGQPIDALYSGPLHRQQTTAAILGATHDCTVKTLAAFDEYDAQALIHRHAKLTGSTLASLQSVGSENGAKLDPRAFQRRLEAVGRAWIAGELEHSDIEPWHSFRGRVAAGIETVMDAEGRSRDIVISTSAGVIGAAVAHVLGLDDHGALRLSWVVLNASITRIRFDGERCSLEGFNAVPHLEAQPEPRALLTYR